MILYFLKQGRIILLPNMKISTPRQIHITRAVEICVGTDIKVMTESEKMSLAVDQILKEKRTCLGE
jgi:hypothetical protein